MNETREEVVAAEGGVRATDDAAERDLDALVAAVRG